MTIVAEFGFQSDFINYLKNKAKLGFQSPPINTNRATLNLGSAYRYVTLVPTTGTKEPVIHPDSDECCSPDVNPASIVIVDSADTVSYDLNITESIIGVITTTASVDINLPLATDVVAGQGFHIKKVTSDGNVVNIVPAVGDTLLEAAAYTNAAPLVVNVFGSSYYVVRVDDDPTYQWYVI